MKKPRVCVLRTDGTNCDRETGYAFERAGGDPHLVHVNQLRAGKKKLTEYQILVIPGGFSYGDDVHSGKILAVELTSFLKEQLQEFVDSGKPVLGICNGFQVLVRTGLLPAAKMGDIRTTLMHNDSGRFECRWVHLRVEDTPCIFTRGLAGRVLHFQAAHGEGKFYTDAQTLAGIEAGKQVVFRYSTSNGDPTSIYPHNPNGSLAAIAGICDPSGRVLGLMPHPERFVDLTQHPNWRRQQFHEPHGLPIFRNAVAYAQEM
ncbi:phosphoribosylformylglycinamidine synthase [Desulfofundulus luciae]|uniref:Phosphoribosylformylglycinamidine synthase subunit PurQ n=1 Tax=Desulfofundulus luciae TaxID=74702 RepID=A0ABU0B258_9FIRM|nr:phosphoribosylformylglycinamidine synthase I [Desulfofundulus luciae]MDQ0286011.1 phosphoribosylformylglycinamidine synthase [Desulfofundulus luciae]